MKRDREGPWTADYPPSCRVDPEPAPDAIEAAKEASRHEYEGWWGWVRWKLDCWICWMLGKVPARRERKT